MSMSLVGDYADSESDEESGEDPEEEQVEEVPKAAKPTVSLPSAADLFDSVGTASFMSTPSSVPESPYTKTPKSTRGGGGGASSRAETGNNGSSSKKRKTENAGSKGAKKEPSRGLLPPQISRPNVVTEDSALWSSDATVKRQRQLQADRRVGARSEAGGAKGEKGEKGKDLSFKQREKVKRDKGQQSRGKSYVEEEKRLLRELGSS